MSAPTAAAAVKPRRLVNDADAFGLGERVAGSAREYQRFAAITLGTGVGSAFLDGGTVISAGPSVPPDGHVYRLLVNGRPLEETVGGRAVVTAYTARVRADDGLDAGDVAARALGGDGAASAVFETAFLRLGQALAPWLTRFGAQALVVGGGLTASWSLLADPLRRGLGDLAQEIAVVKSSGSDTAAAVGASWHGEQILRPRDVEDGVHDGS